MTSDFVEFAEQLADTAGAVIRPYFRTPLLAEDKSDDSPVTRADRDAEQAMRGIIAARQPGHGILGEEFGRLDQDSRWCWVLDPIDGTRSFITGRPSFATLIGLLCDGEPVLGVIDQPITGERWIGARGQRTRFRGPYGGSPGTRACEELASAELSATSPEMFGTRLPCFQRLSAAARRTSWGGDGYAYGLLALGQIDVIAECGLKPWDWAALAPVIEGAGGRVTDWQGAALTVRGPGEVLAVGDARLLPQIVPTLARRSS
jgi:myo-inositol-1(or 4)-monophosphatase